MIKARFKAKILEKDDILLKGTFIRVPKITFHHVVESGPLGQIAPAKIEKELNLSDSRLVQLPDSRFVCTKGGLVSEFEVSVE